MGAYHIVDRDDLVNDVLKHAPDGVDWIFSPFSESNEENYAKMLKTGGAAIAIETLDAKCPSTEGEKPVVALGVHVH